MRQFGERYPVEGYKRSEPKWPWLMVFVIALIVLVAVLVEAENIDSSKYTDLPTIEITVRPGETLWDYSRKYAPEGMHQQAYIGIVRDINNLECAMIYAGQILQIPDGRCEE